MMTQTSILSDKFLELRLGGMRKAFEEQLQDPGSYTDFSFDERLDLLLERERVERESNKLRLRLARAQFKERVSISDLRPNSQRGLDTPRFKSLASFGWLQSGRNLIVTGASGVGKSWLAQGLAHKACLMGHSVRYFRESNLFSEFEASRSEGTLKRLFKKLAAVQLLVIDDFCLGALTEVEEKDLFELVDLRHKTHSTILTSQNPVSQWHGMMPNAAIADAILDRLIHHSERVELEGPSRRKEEHVDNVNMSQ